MAHYILIGKLVKGSVGWVNLISLIHTGMVKFIIAVTVLCHITHNINIVNLNKRLTKNIVCYKSQIFLFS